MYVLVEEKTIYKPDFSIYYKDEILEKSNDPNVLRQQWNARVDEQQRNATPDKMEDDCHEVHYTQAANGCFTRCRVIIKHYNAPILH
jgi:hypothetical protein